jgi:hypothetical protein
MTTHRVTWYSAIHARTGDNTYTHDGTQEECKAIADHMRQQMIAPVITIEPIAKAGESFHTWLLRTIEEDNPANGGSGLLWATEGETVGVANTHANANEMGTR